MKQHSAITLRFQIVLFINVVIQIMHQLAKSLFWLFISGGGLDIFDTTPGQLAEFKMWNHELSADQINVAPCQSPGTVSSWNMLKKIGDSLVTFEHFPSCKCKSHKFSFYNTILTNSYCENWMANHFICYAT